MEGTTDQTGTGDKLSFGSLTTNTTHRALAVTMHTLWKHWFRQIHILQHIFHHWHKDVEQYFRACEFSQWMGNVSFIFCNLPERSGFIYCAKKNVSENIPSWILNCVMERSLILMWSFKKMSPQNIHRTFLEGVTVQKVPQMTPFSTRNDVQMETFWENSMGTFLC